MQLLERRSVYLEPKYPGRDFELDPYNRVLAYIRLDDGRDFGLVLVTDGLCEDFSWKYPHPRSAEYLRAQQLAARRHPRHH